MSPSIAAATELAKGLFLSRVKPPKAALRALDRKSPLATTLAVAIDGSL